MRFEFESFFFDYASFNLLSVFYNSIAYFDRVYNGLSLGYFLIESADTGESAEELIFVKGEDDIIILIKKLTEWVY